jgi:hypothetical protein
MCRKLTIDCKAVLTFIQLSLCLLDYLDLTLIYQLEESSGSKKLRNFLDYLDR